MSYDVWNDPGMAATTIRERRESAGMTQFELAVASGVSLSTIARAESGRDVLPVIAAAIDQALNGTASCENRLEIGARPAPVKKRAGSTTKAG